MFWRSITSFLIALVYTSQGIASSTTSPQHHHWKRINPFGPQARHDAFPRGPSPGRGLYFGPTYTFVPGKGIIDEACNLPTSACPNSQRAN